ncbi:hypothetical protein GRX03_12010 [Halovenus sp. WSH3]|uniref:Uncharacterized protein n=1 Tax=Halovenus carboxidivorans TaxID=2692199 RepID=A0A6B0T2M5_9EURY|nr:hypothetical protein [Halovenus carboxidivorans]MXR52324.1 hypothetical protein [Halovenus carboxidivorans]
MIEVATYDDLASHDRLTGSAVDVVAETLLRRPESVVVAMDEWLVEEKDLTGVSGRHPELVVGVIARETDDAWLVSEGSAEDWVPKSCACAFELADDHDLSTPQEGLDAFADGGRPLGFETPDEHGSIQYAGGRDA